MTAITRKEHIHTNTQTQNLLRELFAWSISGEVRILFGCTGNSGTGCMVFALYGPTHAFPAHRATPLFSDKSTLSSFPRYQETTGGKKGVGAALLHAITPFHLPVTVSAPSPSPPFFFFFFYFSICNVCTSFLFKALIEGNETTEISLCSTRYPNVKCHVHIVWKLRSV